MNPNVRRVIEGSLGFVPEGKVLEKLLEKEKGKGCCFWADGGRVFGGGKEFELVRN